MTTPTYNFQTGVRLVCSNTFGYNPKRRSPWGRIQDVRKIADGISWISTAGHGGFRLSKTRYEQMPEYLRACSFTRDQFFEEDCSWCAVVLAFPQFFNADQSLSASMTFRRHYGNQSATAEVANFPAP